MRKRGGEEIIKAGERDPPLNQQADWQNKDMMNRSHVATTVVAALTLCWYLTSSKNAVATQQLVQHFHQHFPVMPIDPNSPHSLNFVLMTSLTALQLIMGLCIASIVSWCISSCSTTRISIPDPAGTTKNIQACRISLIIGILHYVGTFFTNLGFAYGSASIVQVVKLLEPVETLILTLIVTSSCFPISNGVKKISSQEITPLKAISVLVIVVGTSMILLSKNIKKNVNLHTIMYALFSGFAMSSRNVAQKTLRKQVNSRRIVNATTRAEDSWKETMLLGLNNFIQITSYAVLPSVLGLGISFFKYTALQGIEGENILKWIVMSTGKPGVEAIVFHGLYNIASISVLSAISAQSHSLLNVGKRVWNVMVAAVIFHDPLGRNGFFGLSIAAIGGLMYSKAGTAGGPRNMGTRTAYGIRWNVHLKASTLLISVIVILNIWVFPNMHHVNVQYSSMIGSNEMNVGTASFDPVHPEWPLTVPIVRKDCKVMFRNNQMSLCHITPWKNFGDELGPPIVKRILELHFGCSTDDLNVFDLRNVYVPGGTYSRTGSGLETCLMSVGSLWRMAKSGDHMWGTGVAYNGTIRERCKPGKSEWKKQRNKVENITIYSSRGPLSAGQVGEMCSQNVDRGTPSYSGKDSIEGAGDAGFLVPFLFPELKRNILPTSIHGVIGNEKNKRTCIVPHKQDADKRVDALRKIGQSAEILTVDIGWVNMTLNMQACDEVVSSSLHGIILAEALGIASRRVRITWSPGDFKFSDFYMSYRGTEPEIVRHFDLESKYMLPPLSNHEREEYARRVLKTFPVHLFHVVDTL